MRDDLASFSHNHNCCYWSNKISRIRTPFYYIYDALENELLAGLLDDEFEIPDF